MSYCTQADLVTRFGNDEILQLSDKARVGEIDSEVVNRAIDDASAEIDGYLAGRYRLPLSAVPALLTLYACDIARYRLFEDGAYEQVIERYNNALRYLRDVAQGKVQLFVADADVPANQDVVMQSRPARFTGGF